MPHSDFLALDGVYVEFSQALRKGQLLSIEMTREILTPKVVAKDDTFRGYAGKYSHGKQLHP